MFNPSLNKSPFKKSCDWSITWLVTPVDTVSCVTEHYDLVFSILHRAPIPNDCMMQCLAKSSISMHHIRAGALGSWQGAWWKNGNKKKRTEGQQNCYQKEKSDTRKAGNTAPSEGRMMAGLRTSKTTVQRCQKLSVFNGITKQPSGRVKGTRCCSSEDWGQRRCDEFEDIWSFLLVMCICLRNSVFWEQTPSLLPFVACWFGTPIWRKYLQHLTRTGGSEPPLGSCTTMVPE